MPADAQTNNTLDCSVSTLGLSRLILRKNFKNSLCYDVEVDMTR